MLKLLCVLGGWTKKSEPNALCLEEIIRYWKSSGHIVEILSIENDSSYKNNNNVICVQDFLPNNKYIRNIYKFVNMPLRSKKLASKIANKIDLLNFKNHYNAIIFVVNPIENELAMKLVEKKGQLNILYEIDPASNRYKNPKNLFEKYWKKKSMNFEKKIYKSADLLIHMKNHYKHFSNNFYEEFEYKTIFLDIPGIRDNILPVNKPNGSLIYAGAFYLDLRNPEYMLKVISQAINNINIKVMIYTNSQLDILKKYAKNNEKIIIYDYISKEQLNDLYCLANAFLDIGNHDSDFLASKVFDYISTGKPIIHFSTSLNDVCIPYLRKYQNALIILQSDDFENNVRLVKDFIKKSFSMQMIEKERVLNIFAKNTPAYTGEAIINEINNYYKK